MREAERGGYPIHPVFISPGVLCSICHIVNHEDRGMMMAIRESCGIQRAGSFAGSVLCTHGCANHEAAYGGSRRWPEPPCPSSPSVCHLQASAHYPCIGRRRWDLAVIDAPGKASRCATFPANTMASRLSPRRTLPGWPLRLPVALLAAAALAALRDSCSSSPSAKPLPAPRRHVAVQRSDAARGSE